MCNILYVTFGTVILIFIAQVSLVYLGIEMIEPGKSNFKK